MSSGLLVLFYISLMTFSLANAEMRLILSRVHYNFDLELDERSENWSRQETYILWNKPCLYIRLRPRVVM